MKTINEITLKIFESVNAKLDTFLKSGTIKAHIFKTADNVNLDFTDDEIKEPFQIYVGAEARIEGKGWAEGDFLMPDASKLIFKDGKVKKIIPAPERALQIAALSKQNTELKVKLTEAHALLRESQNFVREIQTDIRAFAESTKKLIGPREPFKKPGRKPLGLKRPFHLK